MDVSHFCGGGLKIRRLWLAHGDSPITQRSPFVSNQQKSGKTSINWCDKCICKEKKMSYSARSSSLLIEFEFHRVSNFQVRTCIMLNVWSSFSLSDTSFSGIFEVELSLVWHLRVKTRRLFELWVAQSGTTMFLYLIIFILFIKSYSCIICTWNSQSWQPWRTDGGLLFLRGKIILAELYGAWRLFCKESWPL